MRPIGRSRIDVEAHAFHRHFLRLITQTTEFAVKKFSDLRFVARDGFDVDQLARERNDIHAEEDSRGCASALTSSLCILTSYFV